MGIFDRVKNMFTEEVDEPIADDVVNEEVKKEEKNLQEDIKVTKKEERIAPIFFDEHDFETLDRHIDKPKEEKKQLEEKLYTKKVEQPEKKVFKLSPVISPVYGVLDKNYHKDDITSKRSNTRPSYYDSENLTIDEVRKKAYGTLEDEIENTLLKNDDNIAESRMKRIHSNDVLLEELMDPNYEPKMNDKNYSFEEETKTLEPYALDSFFDDEQMENSIDYKDPNEDTLAESDLFNLIDSMYDKEDE